MTTGSISASAAERKLFAQRTRWWNSTGGGSTSRTLDGSNVPAHQRTGFGAIKAGDGGKRFREQWPDEDAENWKVMTQEKIDPQTGMREDEKPVVEASTEGVRRRTKGKKEAGVAAAANAAANQQSWFSKNKYYVIGGVLFAYVLVARLLKDQQDA